VLAEPHPDNSHVTDISRAGFDKLKTKGREAAPLEIRYQNGQRAKVLRADAVNRRLRPGRSPNSCRRQWPARHRRDASRRQDRLGMPDVLGQGPRPLRRQTVAVLGAGHSAIGTLTISQGFAEQVPDTKANLAVARQRSRQGLWRRRQ